MNIENSPKCFGKRFMVQGAEKKGWTIIEMKIVLYKKNIILQI